MPTKINKSPLTVIPPQLITMGVKGIVGGITGGLSSASQAIKDIDKEEFKDMKFGEKLKTGLGVYGKSMKGFLGGTAQGLIGTDFGLVDDGEDNLEEEMQPTYKTNIDPMTGQEIPLMMTGNMKPLKMLTGIKGNIPHNMSAKQHNDALKMQEISGANTLPSPMAKMADKDYDGDGKIESSKEEYFGSRDKAIKENQN